MVKELCPECGTELEGRLCPNCGYKKPRMVTPSSYGSSGGFVSDRQRRWWFGVGIYIRGRRSGIHGRSASVSSGNIGYTVAKTAIKSVSPPLATAMAAGEIAYAGYKEVSSAISESQKIWKSERTYSEKASAIAEKLSEASKNTAKASVRPIISSVSGEITSALIGCLESTGTFDSIEKATGIEGVGDVSKELLSDTIKERVLGLGGAL